MIERKLTTLVDEGGPFQVGGFSVAFRSLRIVFAGYGTADDDPAIVIVAQS